MGYLWEKKKLAERVPLARKLDYVSTISHRDTVGAHNSLDDDVI